MSTRLYIPQSRLKSVFPPGFDSESSSNSRPFTFTPEQFYIVLVDNYVPDNHVESITVKSAWFGKQRRSAEHEFILIQVEDTRAEELTNYLVLDRNTSETRAAPTRMEQFQTLFQETLANDAFKVSYDGDLNRFLSLCQLESHRFLEQLQFHSEEPLLLYELITLADIVSKRFPNYQAIESGCYFYAGVIWECMRKMCPGATYDDRLAGRRGTFGWVRFTPRESHIEEACRALREKLPDIQSKIEEMRTVGSLKQPVV